MLGRNGLHIRNQQEKSYQNDEHFYHPVALKHVHLPGFPYTPRGADIWSSSRVLTVPGCAGSIRNSAETYKK